MSQKNKQEELQNTINTIGDGYKIVPIDDELFKIIREGKTAVAITSSYGSGWSSNGGANAIDAQFNVLFLTDQIDKIKEICKQMEYYDGGVDKVQIEWIDIGEEFIINNYDGEEYMIYKNHEVWHTA
jgi:hypothetical protein